MSEFLSNHMVWLALSLSNSNNLQSPWSSLFILIFLKPRYTDCSKSLISQDVGVLVSASRFK